MRRFITNTSLFLVIALLSYPLIVFFWGEITHPRLHPNLNYLLGAYGHHYSRSKEVKTTENVDILFLGSSHAYRGFDPRVFEQQGLSVFNLGSSSQSPIQTKVLLKRYLKQLNPKLVVYEVYPTTFWSDGVESSLDILANDYVDRFAFEMALNLNHIKVYNSLFYSYLAQKGGSFESFEENEVIDKDRYIKGGYVEKELAYCHLPEVDSFSWKIRDDQLKAFEENLQLIKKNESELLLVLAPITRARYSKARNNPWFDSTMTSYGSYINFNRPSMLVDTIHFYDEHHLNQKGVEIFNSVLIPITHKYTSGNASSKSGW